MNADQHLPADLVTAAADLGRRDTERDLQHTNAFADSPLVVARMRNDERVDVISLERHLDSPLRGRGNAELHDPTDWAGYVRRLHDEEFTTIWADPDSGRITAVFDDHAAFHTPMWRCHTATLVLKVDPDWNAWIASNNMLSGQACFAELIENLAHTVVDPEPATMLEIARTFDAKRTVNFSSGVRLDSGDVQLTYEETAKAKAGERGQLDIPYAFTVHIAPFLGVPAADIQARLRWRIQDGELRIGYALLRPDHVRRDIIAALIGELRDQVEPVPVFMGLPPKPVQA